jgi:hypothetical protein
MTASRLLLFAALSALVAAPACDKPRTEPVPTGSAPITAATSSATPAASAPPAAVASAQTPTVEAKMAEHFAAAATLRDSLIKGDLEGFHAAAATISDKELSANLSDTWKPYLEAMRTAAKRARDAKTIGAGATALAEVGRACATCHEKLGSPKLAIGEPPAAGSGTKPHMARHEWAAARMWEGLMAPSQDAWTKGAEVFTDAPLHEEAIAGARSVSPEIGELAKRAHAFGQEAHTARDQAARAKAVAEIYGTCVGCHTKLGVAIK